MSGRHTLVKVIYLTAEEVLYTLRERRANSTVNDMTWLRSQLGYSVIEGLYTHLGSIGSQKLSYTIKSGSVKPPPLIVKTELLRLRTLEHHLFLSHLQQ
jgi:hypothetical protein